MEKALASPASYAASILQRIAIQDYPKFDEQYENYAKWLLDYYGEGICDKTLLLMYSEDIASTAKDFLAYTTSAQQLLGDAAKILALPAVESATTSEVAATDHYQAGMWGQTPADKAKATVKGAQKVASFKDDIRNKFP